MQGPVLASPITCGGRGGQANHASGRQSRAAGHGSADRAARATDPDWLCLSAGVGEIAAHHRPRAIYARAPGDVARQLPRAIACWNSRCAAKAFQKILAGRGSADPLLAGTSSFTGPFWNHSWLGFEAWWTPLSSCSGAMKPQEGQKRLEHSTCRPRRCGWLTSSTCASRAKVKRRQASCLEREGKRSLSRDKGVARTYGECQSDVPAYRGRAQGL
jgi:hypothetical protein